MPKMFCFFFLIRNILNPSVHLDPKAVGTRLVELEFFFFLLSVFHNSVTYCTMLWGESNHQNPPA